MVTQVFGNYNPDRYGRAAPYHKGIDYGVLPNNPVYACMPGIVHTAINQQTGYGRHIRIIHPDGSMSVYGHLNALLVQVGETVEAGQLIGKSGGDKNDKIDGDGNTSGPHLHWEIRPPGKHASDQTAVDPMEYCLKYQGQRVQVAEVSAGIGLNVRSQPSASSSKLGAVYRKAIIHVAEVRDGWARIHSLRPEWVSAAYLYFTGEVIEPKDVVVVPPPKPEPTLDEKVEILWKKHQEIYG